jgi:hypothetical protein
MAITVDEMPDSRATSHNPPSHERKYRVSGTLDESLAISYAVSASPAVYYGYAGALYRQDVKVDPDGWNRWIATVPYGPLTQEYGSFHFGFDTTGGTARLKASKAHYGTYFADASTSATSPYKGSIGVTPTGEVEGVDIVIPALRLSYTIKQPLGLVTESYAKRLAKITGYINAFTFRGFAPGELLFMGARGEDGSNTEASVSYDFLASADAVLTIGGINNIVKYGHAYLWVAFKPSVESNQHVQVPRSVHVERVYDVVDFAAMLGWS